MPENVYDSQNILIEKNMPQNNSTMGAGECQGRAQNIVFA